MPSDSADEQSQEPIEILLVEPNPGDSRLFTESFKDAKIVNNLHVVSDGEAALDFVNQRDDYADRPRPDLILLEPRLPGKSGMEVLAELNNEPAFSAIPIVILTSSETEEDIAKSHGLDADQYIQKPVEPDEFIDFVQSVEEFWLAIVHQSAPNN
ncbi:response regulator [Natrarchaeobius halalkaliphilus]|uniref:Response regulator n=1 Tax=Natrarchaeobius halalkaliphilus TaxID=1679091 RepID=A0A3N6LPV5_9EURY|nr:response regulator [Natrarchaeobius halalkaliphilus]RQG91568.1 response regulator [Natrarchaeobius halalkaliphilus]